MYLYYEVIDSIFVFEKKIIEKFDSLCFLDICIIIFEEVLIKY